jgi:hypothetical protein
MKKQVLYHLLAVVSVILLIGLIASCSENPEPQFKIIESMEYTATNETGVRYTLIDKHLSKKQYLPSADAQSIWAQYRSDVRPLITQEMQNKNPAIGLFMVIKVDQYMVLGKVYWDGKPGWAMNYWVLK